MAVAHQDKPPGCKGKDPGVLASGNGQAVSSQTDTCAGLGRNNGEGLAG